MTESFVLREPEHAASPANRRTVFITGAGGRIGSNFAEHHHEDYDLTLMVRTGIRPSPELSCWGEVVHGELKDLEELTRLFGGHDTVVHLAAVPSPHADWEELLPNNIVGTYNVLTAALNAGCRRVVFASSIHAVSGYPARFQVHDHDPVNPGDLYGVTKCFGEALGRYMAEQEGLSVIALRIGAFQPLSTARDPSRVALMNAFVSHGDLRRLLVRCIDDTRLQFAIFHALSNNRFNRMDISAAEELVGYAPHDDFTRENPNLKNLRLDEQVRPHNEKQK